MTKTTVMLVTRDGLGQVAAEDRAFGRLMFDNLIHTLETAEEKPAALCFYTEGVRLLCDGSPALLGLQLLQGLGVRLVACQSCLEQYGLRDAVRAGEVLGMSDIVSILMSADTVITV
jgi:intracellular sulfur oxidation DsrE/DsrF family protein